MKNIALNQKDYIGKTYIRKNWAKVINEVKGGKIYYVSDRGVPEAAIVPISLLTDESYKKPTPISETKAFGMWKNRDDMKDPLEWERKIRSERFNREWGIVDDN